MYCKNHSIRAKTAEKVVTNGRTLLFFPRRPRRSAGRRFAFGCYRGRRGRNVGCWRRRRATAPYVGGLRRRYRAAATAYAGCLRCSAPHDAGRSDTAHTPAAKLCAHTCARFLFQPILPSDVFSFRLSLKRLHTVRISPAHIYRTTVA